VREGVPARLGHERGTTSGASGASSTGETAPHAATTPGENTPAGPRVYDVSSSAPPPYCQFELGTTGQSGRPRQHAMCLPVRLLGQADRLLRPLRRRAPRIARPARVRIRNRNPCVLARLRLLGWKVRFPLLTSEPTPGLTSCSRSRRASRRSLRQHTVPPDTEEPPDTEDLSTRVLQPQGGLADARHAIQGDDRWSPSKWRHAGTFGACHPRNLVASALPC